MLIDGLLIPCSANLQFLKNLSMEGLDVLNEIIWDKALLSYIRNCRKIEEMRNNMTIDNFEGRFINGFARGTVIC